MLGTSIVYTPLHISTMLIPTTPVNTMLVPNIHDATHFTMWSAAVGLSVFDGFITPALPVTAGCEWRLLALFIALVRHVFVGNEVADESH